jgi:hypothetical protein
MAQARGSQAKLLMDFESTYGADPVSAASVLAPFNTCDLVTKRDRIDPKTITGSRNPVMPIEGNVECSGQVVVPVDAVNFGYWLKALFGAPDTTPAADLYDHVFTVPEELPSFLLEIGYTDVDEYFKYNGCKTNGFSIEFLGKEAELTAKIDVMGAKRTLSGTTYDSDPTIEGVDRFQMKQLTIKEGGSSFDLAGSVSIEIKNNLDGESWVIGGGGMRGALPEGVVNVSGTLKAMFTDGTLYGKAIASTETSLELTATNGDNVLTILIPEMKYVESDPKHVPGGIWAELQFGGYYDNSTEESAIQITLTNDHASYA